MIYNRHMKMHPWKVPGRQIYCDTLRAWVGQTLWCHVVLRFFKSDLATHCAAAVHNAKVNLTLDQDGRLVSLSVDDMERLAPWLRQNPGTAPELVVPSELVRIRGPRQVLEQFHEQNGAIHRIG